MMAPTTETPDRVETSQNDDDDARIASILGDHPDFADDDDDAGIPDLEQHAKPGETGEEADDGEGEIDPDDWVMQTEDEETETDDSEPDDTGGKFVGNAGKVRLDDGRIVTVAQLKEGALLQDDYAGRQKEVGEYASQLNSAGEQLRAQFAQIEQQHNAALEVLRAIMPPQPSVEMARNDPLEYQAQMAEFSGVRDVMQNMLAQQQELSIQRQQFEAQQKNVHLQTQMQQFLGAMPALRDQKKFAKFREEVVDLARSYGATDADLGKLTDSWMLRMAAEAAMYRRIKNAKPDTRKKVEGKPSIKRPGVRRTRNEASAQRKGDLFNALKRTGREDVADRLLESLVD